MTTCSHPIPVEAALRPSPLSSPSNEQAHHMRLLWACRYDCEQKGSVDEENRGSRIEDRGSRIEGRGSRVEKRVITRKAILDLRSSTLDPRSSSALGLAYPYVQAVVGIQAELICRRANYARRDARIPPQRRLQTKRLSGLAASPKAKTIRTV